jgi:phosphatidylinositol glycan class N
MDHIQRHDVAQADIAALMAYLAGLAFPTNSVGELPLSYLDTDLKTKAEALLVNAQEILEMYHVKENLKRSNELRYKAFPGLGDETHSVEYRVSQIRKAIDKGETNDAIRQIQELIQLGLQGLRYLQTYDWLFLRTLITLGYLGWIAFALTTVIDLHVLRENSKTVRTLSSNIVFSSILVVLYSVLFKQQSPWIYYAYAFFPVLFWEEVWARLPAIKQGVKVLFANVSSPADIARLSLSIFGFFGLLVALVSFHSYSHYQSAPTDSGLGRELFYSRNLHHMLLAGIKLADVLW